MCDYCEPLGTATDDYPVFEDMFDSWPVECCEVMCYTGNHEVYLVRHAVDWYLALVNVYDGTGDTVSVSACPMCGRELGSQCEKELEQLVRDMYDVAARGEFDVGEEFKFSERMAKLGVVSE